MIEKPLTGTGGKRQVTLLMSVENLNAIIPALIYIRYTGYGFHKVIITSILIFYFHSISCHTQALIITKNLKFADV